LPPNVKQQVSLENNVNFVVMKKRKTYSAGSKTKVVLEVRQERETVREKITPHRGDNLNWMTYQ
jgi:hypothetical protein